MGNFKDVRLTASTMRVLRLFLENPSKPYSGVDITKEVGTPSGTLYPILIRLERARWLSSNWEDLDPKDAGRPRRRYYKLTAFGQKKAFEALSELVPGAGRLGWT